MTKYYHIACGDEVWCYNTATNKDKCVDEVCGFIGDEITFNKKNLKYFKKNEKFEKFIDCVKFRDKICGYNTVNKYEL